MLRTLLVVAIVFGAVMPLATAVNECAQTARCVEVSTRDVKGTVNAVPLHTYYVWTDSLSCPPPPSGHCAGFPYARVVGIVYEETNGVAGLQRYPSALSANPDRAVLV